MVNVKFGKWTVGIDLGKMDRVRLGEGRIVSRDG